MKAEMVLKLKALEREPQIKFIGNQKGFECGEVYPLYNVYLKGHNLNGSTVTIETIEKEGFVCAK